MRKIQQKQNNAANQKRNKNGILRRISLRSLKYSSIILAMNRYSYKNLKADVEILNAKLAEKGHNMRFIIGGRNGYTAIDLATIEQLARHACERMLVGGSPRECLAACHEYIVHNV
jgi:hypothetical protein